MREKHNFSPNSSLKEPKVLAKQFAPCIESFQIFANTTCSYLIFAKFYLEALWDEETRALIV